MDFAYPAVLLVLLLLVPALFAASRMQPRSIPLPSLAGATRIAPSLRLRFMAALPALRLLAVVLLVIAAARPRTGSAETVIPAEGIDIVLALDLSESMSTAIGNGVSRIQAAKDVLAGFVDSRTDDRIGLVVFQSEAEAVIPPTLDHAALARVLEDIERAYPLGGKTAIGLGLAASVQLLEDSAAASRVVILLTDGQNNVDVVQPLEAAQIAANLRIRVYTIGIGSEARPLTGIDATTLTAVAEETGGRYFSARSADDLDQVYEEIGKLETSSVERDRFTRYTEYGPLLALAAAGLLAADAALRSTWLRRVTA